MFLQAALNGSRVPGEHPRVPTDPDSIAADADACWRAGASGVHVHPRDADGVETLDPDAVAAVCSAIRARCPIEVGVTTELSIAGDAERRRKLVAAWTLLPDVATVNVAEEGWRELADGFLERGVGVEAGVWTPADVERLTSSGLDRVLRRVLVEPIGTRSATALDVLDALHRALDDAGSRAPRLQHTEDETGWLVIDDALRRGIATRVGLEDLLVLPDGRPAPGNAALVRAVLARAAPG